MGRPPAPPLACGYYLDNFETVLVSGIERHRDLLAARNSSSWRTFRAASLDARRLYARLVARRGPWFRCDRLRYPEIAAAARSRSWWRPGWRRWAMTARSGAHRAPGARRAPRDRRGAGARAPAVWRSLRRAELGAGGGDRRARQWGPALRRARAHVATVAAGGAASLPPAVFRQPGAGLDGVRPRRSRRPPLRAGARRRGAARPFTSRTVLDQHLELRRIGERIFAAPATEPAVLAALLSRVGAGDWDPSTRRAARRHPPAARPRVASERGIGKRRSPPIAPPNDRRRESARCACCGSWAGSRRPGSCWRPFVPRRVTRPSGCSERALLSARGLAGDGRGCPSANSRSREQGRRKPQRWRVWRPRGTRASSPRTGCGGPCSASRFGTSSSRRFRVRSPTASSTARSISTRLPRRAQRRDRRTAGIAAPPAALRPRTAGAVAREVRRRQPLGRLRAGARAAARVGARTCLAAPTSQWSPIG